MTVTGDQIMAPGESLTLADGSEVKVRYGYRELWDIEDEFGSIEVLSNALSDGFKGKFFSTLVPALAIGIRLPGEKKHMNVDDLVDRLDTQRTTEYVEVFGRSLQQAFPKATPEAVPAQDEIQPQVLTGQSTTTSQPVVITEPTNNF